MPQEDVQIIRFPRYINFVEGHDMKSHWRGSWIHYCESAWAKTWIFWVSESIIRLPELYLQCKVISHYVSLEPAVSRYAGTHTRNFRPKTRSSGKEELLVLLAAAATWPHYTPTVHCGTAPNSTNINCSPIGHKIVNNRKIEWRGQE